MSDLRKGIILLVLSTTFGCREAAVHDLNEAQAHELYTRLSEQGISVEKRAESGGKWALEVPHAQLGDAIRQISHSRVLQVRAEPPETGGGLLASREDQQLRMLRTIAKDLEQTLSALEGVLEARVHLFVPVGDPLFAVASRERRSSASIFLRVESQFTQRTEEISALVAGATGLDPSVVSVLVARDSRHGEPARTVEIERERATEASGRSAESEEPPVGSGTAEASDTLAFGQETGSLGEGPGTVQRDSAHSELKVPSLVVRALASRTDGRIATLGILLLIAGVILLKHAKRREVR